MYPVGGSCDGISCRIGINPRRLLVLGDVREWLGLIAAPPDILSVLPYLLVAREPKGRLLFEILCGNGCIRERMGWLV